MGRSILAVMSGMILAFFSVFAIESIGHAVYPPPAGFESSDPSSLHELMAKMPTGAFLFLLSGWVVGAAAGSWLAARISRRAPIIHGLIVGGLIIAASIAIMVHIPHPAWFWVVSLVTLVSATYAGASLGNRGGGSGRDRSDSLEGP